MSEAPARPAPLEQSFARNALVWPFALPRKYGQTARRWLRPTYFNLFLLYMVLVVVGGAGVLMAFQADLTFVDAMFMTSAAFAQAGLASRDISAMDPRVAIWLAVTIMLGSTMMQTIVPLLLRTALFDPRQASRLDLLENHAVRKLIRIVIGFYYGTLIFGFFVLAVWVSNDSYALTVLTRNNNNIFGWAAFTSISSLHNTGLSTISDNMVPFYNSPLPLLVSSVLTLCGETVYPIIIRQLVWVMSKLSTGYDRLAYKYLLENSRRVYTHMFKRSVTMWLLLVVVVVNVVEFVLFLGLDWESGAVNFMTPGEKVLNAVFTSFATRKAGFNSVAINLLNNGMLALLIGSMYLSTSPVLAAVRSSSARAKNGVYDQARGLLTQDSLYLFLIFVIICAVENDRLTSDPNFSVFGIIFEITSGYGTVGLSLGYPNTTTSFSAVWTTASKLLMVVTMLMGRLRGFPEEDEPAVRIFQIKMTAEDQRLLPLHPHNDEDHMGNGDGEGGDHGGDDHAALDVKHRAASDLPPPSIDFAAHRHFPHTHHPMRGVDLDDLDRSGLAASLGAVPAAAAAASSSGTGEGAGTVNGGNNTVSVDPIAQQYVHKHQHSHFHHLFPHIHYSRRPSTSAHAQGHGHGLAQGHAHAHWHGHEVSRSRSQSQGMRSTSTVPVVYHTNASSASVGMSPGMQRRAAAAAAAAAVTFHEEVMLGNAGMQATLGPIPPPNLEITIECDDHINNGAPFIVVRNAENAELDGSVSDESLATVADHEPVVTSTYGELARVRTTENAPIPVYRQPSAVRSRPEHAPVSTAAARPARSRSTVGQPMPSPPVDERSVVQPVIARTGSVGHESDQRSPTPPPQSHTPLAKRDSGPTEARPPTPTSTQLRSSRPSLNFASGQMSPYSQSLPQLLPSPPAVSITLASPLAAHAETQPVAQPASDAAAAAKPRTKRVTVITTSKTKTGETSFQVQSVRRPLTKEELEAGHLHDSSSSDSDDDARRATAGPPPRLSGRRATFVMPGSAGSSVPVSESEGESDDSDSEREDHDGLREMRRVARGAGKKLALEPMMSIDVEPMVVVDLRRPPSSLDVSRPTTPYDQHFPAAPPGRMVRAHTLTHSIEMHAMGTHAAHVPSMPVRPASMVRALTHTGGTHGEREEQQHGRPPMAPRGLFTTQAADDSMLAFLAADEEQEQSHHREGQHRHKHVHKRTEDADGDELEQRVDLIRSLAPRKHNNPLMRLAKLNRSLTVSTPQSTSPSPPEAHAGGQLPSTSNTSRPTTPGPARV